MVGGGILSRRPGTLSGDGKLLLCPCGKLVNIYSAVTGERVGLLAGHTDEVTGVVLDPENDDQAYSCSLDCTMRLWDYRSGEELRRLVVREPIKYMVIQKELGVAYFSVQMREGGGRVMLYNIRTGKFSGNALKTRSAGPLVLGPTGSLAATIDRHSLFVWRTGTDIHQPLNLHHTKPYTCLALSPDDSLIAAGDVSGRILIWRSFEHSVPSALRDGERGGKAHPPAHPPLTTLHWHAHPVGALTFSQDGTYLLSGGQEGVLVFWQLDSNRRNYLPRLGGPLVGLHTSPADPAKYVVRQADNIVRIVNAATMKVEVSVIGLLPPPVGLAPPPAGVGGGGAALLSAGPSGSLALGGASGGSGVLVVSCENAQLQLYDILRDRHIQLLQIAPRNAVSLTDHAAGTAPGATGPGAPAPTSLDSPFPPFVSLVAFSSDGSVLTTVDVRPDAGPYGATEACLKFWDSAAGGGGGGGGGGGEDPSGAAAPFALNTRVDEPHRGAVTSLSYHPCRHLAVTTGGAGGDSEFKVWVREQRPGAAAAAGRRRGAPGSSATSWRCRSTGGYKGLPLTATAFSADGSVLAVAAAARVTIWNAESNALAAVLPAATAPGQESSAASAAAAPAAAPLTQLAFVAGTPFLAAASPTCLAVYNLLTAAVHWCLPLNAISISADAAYGLLSVAMPAAPEAPPPAATPAAAAALATPGPAAAPDGGAAPATAPAAPAPASGGKATTRQQPSRQQTSAAPPPSCHVVVFDPRDATPRYHCHVPGAAHVHIQHLPVAAGAAAQAQAGGEGCSPLLILRDNRQYSLAAQPGTKVIDTLGPEGLLQREEAVSAFEAAFGRPTGRDEAAPAPMDLDGVSGPSEPVGGRPRWADLFDAPSHVLPPPTTLATAFLTLLTTSDA